MSVISAMAAISGIGLVTPLGADLETIWSAMESGIIPEAAVLSSPLASRTFPYLSVPQGVVRPVERNPRLRRSSEISLFGAVAGLNAMSDAGIDARTPGLRIGVVFAVSSGGVHYTTRFYDEITRAGAGAASPLLFPETVYNAPASHVAALLGVDGASYTVVGDSSVGWQALALAVDLLAVDELDHCVVIGTEEADWIVCEAFRSWRHFHPATRCEAFGGPGRRGTVPAEGAGALVLSRTGPVQMEHLSEAMPFQKADQAAAVLSGILQKFGPAPAAAVPGANGTVLDDAEGQALGATWPDAALWPVKNHIGESLGASVIQQAALAVLALRQGRLPGGNAGLRRIGVTSLGYNLHAGGTILSLAPVQVT